MYAHMDIVEIFENNQKNELKIKNCSEFHNYR